MAFLVAVVLALGALAGCMVAWRRWRAEQRELARVRATFSRYVAPSVVDLLLARKDERLFTGRAVRATILVCRIRDFAHFIEPLTPEQTLRYLNEFYGLAGTAIQRHRGIIESFLGDGIVAVFGVPLDNPTQEDDALRAALDIVRHVVAMRERWARQHRKPFTVGIGINTGEVIAGDAGFRDRREFTVVGSEATFAHRLQEAAYALNAFVVASRATCEPVAGDFKLVPVSGVPLPGVRRLLDAFVVRGRNDGREQFVVPTDALIETVVEPAAVPPDAAPAPDALTAPQPSAALPPAAAGAPVTPKIPANAPTVPGRAPAIATAHPEPPAGRSSLRAQARSTAAMFGIPEMEHRALVPGRDQGPILPEPPAPKATYEDRTGAFDL